MQADPVPQGCRGSRKCEKTCDPLADLLRPRNKCALLATLPPHSHQLPFCTLHPVEPPIPTPLPSLHYGFRLNLGTHPDRALPLQP